MTFTVDFWVFFVIVCTAIAGVGVTYRKFQVARRGLRTLTKLPNIDEGMLVMTRGHLREDSIRLWCHSTFILIGLIQIIPHDRHDPIWWTGTLIVWSMQALMIFGTIRAGVDQEQAARPFREKV